MTKGKEKEAHLYSAFYIICISQSAQAWIRLSWPGWLTHSGRFTHISGHPSATGRAQDRESTSAKDRRSTTEPLRWLICDSFQSNKICPKWALWLHLSEVGKFRESLKWRELVVGHRQCLKVDELVCNAGHLCRLTTVDIQFLHLPTTTTRTLMARVFVLLPR